MVEEVDCFLSLDRDWLVGGRLWFYLFRRCPSPTVFSAFSFQIPPSPLVLSDVCCDEKRTLEGPIVVGEADLLCIRPAPLPLWVSNRPRKIDRHGPYPRLHRHAGNQDMLVLRVGWLVAYQPVAKVVVEEVLLDEVLVEVAL